MERPVGIWADEQVLRPTKPQPQMWVVPDGAVGAEHLTSGQQVGFYSGDEFFWRAKEELVGMIAVEEVAMTPVQAIRRNADAKASHFLFQAMLGSCMAGAVLAGLAFGWTAHPDTFRIVGGVIGAVAYLVASGRR